MYTYSNSGKQILKYPNISGLMAYICFHNITAFWRSIPVNPWRYQMLLLASIQISKSFCAKWFPQLTQMLPCSAEHPTQQSFSHALRYSSLGGELWHCTDVFLSAGWNASIWQKGNSAFLSKIFYTSTSPAFTHKISNVLYNLYNLVSQEICILQARSGSSYFILVEYKCQNSSNIH